MCSICAASTSLFCLAVQFPFAKHGVVLFEPRYRGEVALVVVSESDGHIGALQTARNFVEEINTGYLRNDVHVGEWAKASLVTKNILVNWHG